jgi:threonine/homoserine/homoserine lactone efflux protein
MNNYLAMAAFALAASLSPGPVNVVALGSGARHGFAPSMRHVSGATIGFTALLVFTGFGLHAVTAAWPGFMVALQWGGVAFLLYMAWALATASGELGRGSDNHPPSFWVGAGMQWVNPKAWLAASAGMGAFASAGSAGDIWTFSAIYFAVCYASMAAWAAAGAVLQKALTNAARVRLLNRLLALTLLASAAYLSTSG